MIRNCQEDARHADPRPAARARKELSGSRWHKVRDALRTAGLRPTRQRLVLWRLLFAQGRRHVTAEMLFEEASRMGLAVSLATVYNVLHQFTAVGFLRPVAVPGSKTYFDTDVSDHNHFYIEKDDVVLDIPTSELCIGKVMTLPDGFEISRVDVVVRLRRKQPTG